MFDSIGVCSLLLVFAKMLRETAASIEANPGKRSEEEIVTALASTLALAVRAEHLAKDLAGVA